MNRDERWYFLERARCSLEASERASAPEIAAIHLDLHQRYMNLASQDMVSGATVQVVPRAAQ